MLSQGLQYTTEIVKSIWKDPSFKNTLMNVGLKYVFLILTINDP